MDLEVVNAIRFLKAITTKLRQSPLSLDLTRNESQDRD